MTLGGEGVCLQQEDEQVILLTLGGEASAQYARCASRRMLAGMSGLQEYFL